MTFPELFFAIVAAAEVFFQPAIAHDEEIAASHFANFEFGDAVAAISPGYGRDGPAEASDDRF